MTLTKKDQKTILKSIVDSGMNDREMASAIGATCGGAVHKLLKEIRDEAVVTNDSEPKSAIVAFFKRK